MYFPRYRDTEIVVNELADETLVYDLRTDEAHCLNETCALIWQECDGTKTVAEISRVLTRKLKSPVTDEMIYLALDILSERNLIIDNREPKAITSGVSRRELIRKVGLATVVALPVISSLSAPASVEAASTCQRSRFEVCVQGSSVPAECCQPPYTCTMLSFFFLCQ